MKNQIKKIISTLLIAGIVYFGYTMFTDSSEEFVTKYVEGYINLYYQDNNELYIETTESTNEELADVHSTNVSEEIKYYSTYFELEDLTEKQTEELEGYISDVYKKSKYEVKLAKEVSAIEYEVEVIVHPLDIVKLVEDELIKLTENMNEKEVDEFIGNWNENIIEITKDKIKDVNYVDQETIKVKVTLDSDNLYTIDENSLMEIDTYMIYYPVIEE